MSEINNNASGMINEEDFDEYLDKIKREYKDAWTEENWEEVKFKKAQVFKLQIIQFKYSQEMEKHPFFMTKAPEDGAELPPAVEGNILLP